MKSYWKGYQKKYNEEGRLIKSIEYEIILGTKVIATKGTFKGLEGYVVGFRPDLSCFGTGESHLVCKFPDTKLQNEWIVENNKFLKTLNWKTTSVSTNIDYLM